MATQSTVRKRSSRQSLDGGYFLFLVPGILIFLIFIFIPFIANIVLSFTRWSGVGEIVWIGVANYQKAFTDAIFWASFRNNLLLIIAMTIIPTIGGLVLASFLFDYVAQKIGRRSANFFRAAFYLPQVIPIVIAAVVWRWLYQPEWGVINYILTAIGLESLASNWLGDAATALPAQLRIGHHHYRWRRFLSLQRAGSGPIQGRGSEPG